MSEYLKPLPAPSPESAPFWEGCRQHELRLQRCDKCGQFAFPPTGRCPECLAAALTWVNASGRGRIFSYVVYHRAYHPAFEPEIPYIVALVQLEEGPRLISNLVDCEPDQVRCDLPVHVIFERITGTHTLYKFKPLEQARRSL